MAANVDTITRRVCGSESHLAKDCAGPKNPTRSLKKQKERPKSRLELT